MKGVNEGREGAMSDREGERKGRKGRKEGKREGGRAGREGGGERVGDYCNIEEGKLSQTGSG